jgi:hypothetical protein
MRRLGEAPGLGQEDLAVARRSAVKGGSSIMLRCEECGRESDWEDAYTHVGDPRWKAVYTVDYDVAIYCPDCARNEFGGSDGSRRAA